MLVVELTDEEQFDPVSNVFMYFEPVTVKMEHSLFSLSKWEAHYHKPFITDDEKTPEETIYYIRCMALGDEDLNISEEIAQRIYRSKLRDVLEYIQDPHTATTINNKNQQNKSKEIITAEILYYDLTALQIPWEVQYWHLNRLIMLIQVCSIKNEPPKKMSANERYARQKAINDANRAKYNM